VAVWWALCARVAVTWCLGEVALRVEVTWRLGEVVVFLPNTTNLLKHRGIVGCIATNSTNCRDVLGFNIHPSHS
jgi:hypothetical protein